MERQGRGKGELVDVERLIGSIELTPIATVVTNPRLADNPIIAANEAFVRLTGYARNEIVGRNCRFLAGPGTEEAGRATLREAQAHARSALVEVLNYRKDGSAFRNAVMIAPILDERGQAQFFVGSQVDLGTAAGIARSSEARSRVEKLTPRQRQVLDHLLRGLRNKQIAAALGLSEKTVKMHRAAMLDRLECATSADAIRMGVEAGLAAAT